MAKIPFIVSPILVRRLLEITCTTIVPTDKQLAEHRVIVGLYWFCLCFVAWLKGNY